MSRVGFHRHKAEPGSALAKARMRAHDAFDALWKLDLMSRSQAYLWLAEELGVRSEDCHMVLFDEATCELVRALSDDRFFAELLGQ